MFKIAILQKRAINAQIDKNIESIIAVMKEALENHADILLSYISHNWGGAYKSKQYAQKKNISIIELSKQSI